MSAELSGMAKVSVRELQQQTKRVIERVAHGEIIEVWRQRRPVARLSLVPQHQKPALWPDLGKRARTVFGNRIIKPDAAPVVAHCFLYPPHATASFIDAVEQRSIEQHLDRLLARGQVCRDRERHRSLDH